MGSYWATVDIATLYILDLIGKYLIERLRDIGIKSLLQNISLFSRIFLKNKTEKSKCEKEWRPVRPSVAAICTQRRPLKFHIPLWAVAPNEYG